MRAFVRLASLFSAPMAGIALLLAVALSGCASSAEDSGRGRAAAQRPSVEVALPVTAVAEAQGPIAPSYRLRLVNTIRPHILVAEAAAMPGNPAAEFEIRLAPDGTVTGVALRQTSGVLAWDQAAYRALQKTERLPTDDAGKAPARLIVTLRPKPRTELPAR